MNQVAVVSAFVGGVASSLRADALANVDLQARLAALDDDALVEAVRDDAALAYCLPDARYTRELSLEIVALNGSYLKAIPAAVRALPDFEHDAALAAMWAFGYVSEASKTKELLLDVIREVDFDVAMFGESWAVPIAIMTPDVIHALKAKCAASEWRTAQLQRYLEKRALGAP